MEFIIIAILTTTLAVYSWWAGHKMGERKGHNNGIAEMEGVIKQYWYHNTGDKPCERDNTK